MTSCVRNWTELSAKILGINTLHRIKTITLENGYTQSTTSSGRWLCYTILINLSSHLKPVITSNFVCTVNNNAYMIKNLDQLRACLSLLHLKKKLTRDNLVQVNKKGVNCRKNGYWRSQVTCSAWDSRWLPALQQARIWWSDLKGYLRKLILGFAGPCRQKKGKKRRTTAAWPAPRIVLDINVSVNINRVPFWDNR